MIYFPFFISGRTAAACVTPGNFTPHSSSATLPGWLTESRRHHLPYRTFILNYRHWLQRSSVHGAALWLPHSFFFSYVSSVRWDFKVSLWFINRFLYYSFGGGFCLKSPKNSKDWPLCLRMVESCWRSSHLIFVLRNTIFCPCSGSGSASVDKKQLRAHSTCQIIKSSVSFCLRKFFLKKTQHKQRHSQLMTGSHAPSVRCCLFMEVWWGENMPTVDQTDLPSLTPVTSLHVPELYLRPSGDRKGRQNNRKRHQESARRRNETKSVEFSPNSPHFCEFDLEPTSLWQKTRSGRVSAGWRYMCVVLSYFFDLIKLESG